MHLVRLSYTTGNAITHSRPSQDLCPDNLVLAHDRHAVADRRVEAKKVYIIDFHTSRQLNLPPGVQPAILLPDTQIQPPSGIKHFDPYSWDVYCLAHVFEDLLEVRHLHVYLISWS